MPKIVHLPGGRFCLEFPTGERSKAVGYDQVLIHEECWIAHTAYYGNACVGQLSNYQQAEELDQSI